MKKGKYCTERVCVCVCACVCSGAPVCAVIAADRGREPANFSSRGRRREGGGSRRV